MKNFATERLRQIIDNIEREEAEKAERAENIKAFYAGAKSEGFDTKILRKVIARRKRDPQKAREEDGLIDLYESAAQGDLFASEASGRLNEKLEQDNAKGHKVVNFGE